MCGRYNDHLPKMIGWAEALKVWPEVTRKYNKPPSSNVAAFRSDQGESMRWGLVPKWSREFISDYSTFNARIEGIASKPSFRESWALAQRCLIPMAGYYEWKGLKGSKQPYYITDRDTGGLVVAGLWDEWEDKLSCTIITKPATDVMSHLH